MPEASGAGSAPASREQLTQAGAARANVRPRLGFEFLGGTETPDCVDRKERVYLKTTRSDKESRAVRAEGEHHGLVLDAWSQVSLKLPYLPEAPLAIAS